MNTCSQLAVKEEDEGWRKDTLIWHFTSDKQLKMESAETFIWRLDWSQRETKSLVSFTPPYRVTASGPPHPALVTNTLYILWDNSGLVPRRVVRHYQLPCREKKLAFSCSRPILVHLHQVSTTQDSQESVSLDFTEHINIYYLIFGEIENVVFGHSRHLSRF